jgi:ribosome-associated protein
VNDAKPSKSARKRDYLALQSLGEKLIPLERGELEKLGLDEPLFEAVVCARNMRSRSALRRQRQLIGKLMRDADADAIQSSLDALGRQDRLDRDRFREAERWRDRICSEGAPAVAEFAARTERPAAGLEMLLRELEAAASEAGRRNVRRRIFRQLYRELGEFGEVAALQEPGDQ